MSETEPNWDFYRTFLTVLTEGSLSAAARELGLTQPTIGRHVDALENAIGFQLFIRSPQGLIPTEAALDLKPHVEQLAANAAALLRAATGQGNTVRGTVRISASEVIGIEVLPPMLAALKDRHPDLVIELSVSDAVEDILRQEADIAVRMAPPAQDALITRRIGGIPLGLHAHRHYLDKYGTPDKLEDLRTHQVIGFDRESAFVRAMRKRVPLLDIMRPTLKSDSNLAQLAMIRAGCGIGVCQVKLAKRDPNLIRLFRTEFELPLETFVVMHETMKTTPRCRVTFDALVEGLLAYMGR
ncbi:LysR family transcriptional regulator [Pararhizobium sp. BT-229]|uniref:LysR family transcriptional regulator n=1 Tax=Pararhizobium sp. BT-229 TaxID=2986923 RepID=UPI0021F7E56B|nr:LysR family transcriptional regulator [Pararhizobium sp. BT-229]MCV9961269.1 LysR family transcriptional regulator [Pararhizobium sp. BT-229]